MIYSHKCYMYSLVSLICTNTIRQKGQHIGFMCVRPDEPHREKTGLLPMRKQRRRSAKLISAFVFATRIVQFIFYLNPKFQASGSFLSLYRPVCVGPGRKPRRPVFSRRGSDDLIRSWLSVMTRVDSGQLIVY